MGFLAAVQAAAGSLVVALVPVVGTWVVTQGTHTTVAQAVRVSVAAWLLAHHGGLVVDGGHFALVPLGLSTIPAVSCWFAARRLARSLDPRAERIGAGVSRARPAAIPVRALIAFTLSYALIAGVAGLAATTSGLHPVSAQAVVGAAVVALVSGVFGAAAYRYGGLRRGFWGALRAIRLPPAVRRWVRGGASALGVHLAGSAVLLLLTLLVQYHRVSGLYTALHPDVPGVVVLTLIQLAYLPDAVIWTAAFAAGPGFAVGAGTSVTPVASVIGPLPAFPLLAALPRGGSLPGAVLLVVALPVLAGVVAGTVVARRAPGGSRALLADLFGAVVIAGAMFTVVTWLATGPMGPGRLSESGPSALACGVSFAVEVGLGALLAASVVGAAPALRELWGARGGLTSEID